MCVGAGVLGLCGGISVSIYETSPVSSFLSLPPLFLQFAELIPAAEYRQLSELD